MKEDYNKINNLRFRDRITPSDINFTKSMHGKYCSHLKKNICWECPSSIREAIFDLINYIEKNPLQDENKIDTINEFTGTGEGSPKVFKGSKSGKSTTGSK